MLPKDIFDFINANFKMCNNADCFNKLNCFVDAMHRGQYFPISDEEIHRGVEYKKAEGKALLKTIDFIISDNEKQLAEAMVETLCNQSLQLFLNYKHVHENQNNCVC